MIDAERLAECLEDPGCHLHCGLGVGHIVDEHRELVPTETGDGVGRPHRLAYALGGLAEHVVAETVAEAVVDDLEAIEIEEEHGDRASPAAPVSKRQVHVVEEQSPVRQPRQIVVRGVAQQLGFGFLDRRDVGRDALDGDHLAPVVEHGCSSRLEPDHVPRPMAVPAHDWTGVRREVLVELPHGHALGLIAGAQHQLGVPVQLLRLISEEVDERRAHVLERRVGSEPVPVDHDRCVLGQPAEPLLALAEARLGRFALSDLVPSGLVQPCVRDHEPGPRPEIQGERFVLLVEGVTGLVARDRHDAVDVAVVVDGTH